MTAIPDIDTALPAPRARRSRATAVGCGVVFVALAVGVFFGLKALLDLATGLFATTRGTVLGWVPCGLIAAILIHAALRRVDRWRMQRRIVADSLSRLAEPSGPSVVATLWEPRRSATPPHTLVNRELEAMWLGLCAYVLEVWLSEGAPPGGALRLRGRCDAANTREIREEVTERALAVAEAAEFIRVVREYESGADLGRGERFPTWSPRLTVCRRADAPRQAAGGDTDIPRAHARLADLARAALSGPVGPPLRLVPGVGLLPLRLGSRRNGLVEDLGTHWSMAGRRLPSGATLLRWRAAGIRALLDANGRCVEIAASAPALMYIGQDSPDDDREEHVVIWQHAHARILGEASVRRPRLRSYPDVGVAACGESESPLGSLLHEVFDGFDNPTLAVWDRASHAESLLARPRPAERGRSGDDG